MHFTQFEIITSIYTYPNYYQRVIYLNNYLHLQRRCHVCHESVYCGLEFGTAAYNYEHCQLYVNGLLKTKW